MTIFVGCLGLIGLIAILVLGMRGAERLTSRLLGLPRFRWFEAGQEAGAWWQRLVVRTASAVAPFLVSASMFLVVYWVGGVPEVTTAVTVLEGGAAREAGVRDGDKMLAVGSVPVRSWDEFRSRISVQEGPTELEIERAGARLTLTVTPRAGRIGVVPASVMRPAGFVDSVSSAARLPLQVVEDSAKSVVAAHQQVELKGPVGIMRETGKARRRGALELLFFLGVLAAYFWPFAASMHVFDAATGWVFRMTFSVDVELSQRALRIVRLRQAIYASLVSWLAALLAEVAVATELVPGALLLLTLALPGVWALIPLLWVSAKELWGKNSLLGVLLPVAFLPCAAPFMGVWLALQLRQEEQKLLATRST